MQSKWTTYGKRWSAAAGVLLVMLGCATLTGCKKRIGMTTVEVPDSVRHYYPVIAGQELNLVYDLTNTGDQPLIIRDIQPSCGCIVTMPESRMVLPDKTIRLKFVYQSANQRSPPRRLHPRLRGTVQGGRGAQPAHQGQGGRRGQRAGLLRGHREGQSLARAVPVEGRGETTVTTTGELKIYMYNQTKRRRKSRNRKQQT